MDSKQTLMGSFGRWGGEWRGLDTGGHTRRRSPHVLFPPLCFEARRWIQRILAQGNSSSQSQIGAQKEVGQRWNFAWLEPAQGVCISQALRVCMCASRIILEDASRGSSLLGVFHTLQILSFLFLFTTLPWAPEGGGLMQTSYVGPDVHCPGEGLCVSYHWLQG